MRGLTDEEAEELQCAADLTLESELGTLRALVVTERLARRGLVRWTQEETFYIAGITDRGRLALRLHAIVRGRIAA